MQKIVRLPSRLYRDLFTTGGDRLVAVFCILKSSRAGLSKFYAYKSKNQKNVSGYALLRKQTGLSLSALNKYVPVIVSMGLGSFTATGGFEIIGNEKSKELYSSYKLVPIVVEGSMIQIALNSMLVRIHSEAGQQKKIISKKQSRKRLTEIARTSPKRSDQQRGNWVMDKFGDFTLNSTVTMSNIKYAEVLISNEDSDSPITKSKGAYYKSRLKKRNLIQSQRQFEKMFKLTITEFVFGKKTGQFEKESVYRNGFLCKEVAASLTVNNINTY